jgi:hypothetical protein
VENEFLPEGIEMLNFKSTKDIRGSFFNQIIVFIRTALEGEDVAGTVSLTDETLKRQVRGQSEVMEQCKGEFERWEVLEKWFGIVLRAEERRGIRD